MTGCFIYHKWRHYTSKSKDPLKVPQKRTKGRLRRFLNKDSGANESDLQRSQDLNAMRREASANQNETDNNGIFDNAVFSLHDETSTGSRNTEIDSNNCTRITISSKYETSRL
jgi:hypothetical protein